MSVEQSIHDVIERTIVEALGDSRVQALIHGQMREPELKAFFRRFVVTHFGSVQILSFLYSLAPPAASDLVAENLREEMGLEEAERSHPELVLEVARGIGFSESEIERLVAETADVRRQFISAPLPYGTLREQGLAMLLETLAFESFLSRFSDAVAESLTAHYGLSAESVRWFTLHGEVDVRHAEEGRRVVERYIAFYRFDANAVAAIVRTTFARNVVLERYFPAGPGEGGTPGRAGIESIEIMPLRIPFNRTFEHAQMRRSSSDAVVVRVRDGDGVSGYGEALARPYVTGEGVKSMVTMLRTKIAPPVLAGSFDTGVDVLEQVRALRAVWSGVLHPVSGVSAWNASQCAMELALLDWAFRRAGRSVGEWLTPARSRVMYAASIDAAEPQAAAQLARRYAAAGFKMVKVKVGLGKDVPRLAAVRAELGESARIWVDANGAWKAEKAVAALEALRDTGIEAVEQPVEASDLAGMRRVREETGIPVIADESLITLDDAKRLIAERACDVFNVRVSKCGGLLAAKEIAELGIAAGLKVQIGAQVGETSLLSAAGRHLAAHLPEVEYVEGSFGTHLLSEDVTPDPVMFGAGGQGDLLFGPGLGVQVDDGMLERLAVSTVRMKR